MSNYRNKIIAAAWIAGFAIIVFTFHETIAPSGNRPPPETPQGPADTPPPQVSPRPVAPQMPGPSSIAPRPALPAGEDETPTGRQRDSALARLGDIDPGRRADAAEQLAAYANRAAETALVQALAGDPAAEVRAAAARSLGHVRKPNPATLDALFAALQDPDITVGMAAVGSLGGFLAHDETGSKRDRALRAGFQAGAAAPGVPAAIREILRDALAERGGR
ncbi:HEAT repeat-containing protein [Methylomagnum ishizawai]|uniref:HEAT repeat-containing protein n=2 Tax=Methylomagnum ishizawai TaxID=1760988 RepID=A0A1Y6CUP2_9GAMM|nr:HEAT repeat-containing protein [Methylomagnum ishizawai]